MQMKENKGFCYFAFDSAHVNTASELDLRCSEKNYKSDEEKKRERHGATFCSLDAPGFATLSFLILIQKPATFA